MDSHNANIKPKSDKATGDVSYDDLLSTAGKLGRYQWYLVFATAPFYGFGVFAYFSQLFLTEVSPNHWCRIPELENFTEIQRRDLAIPKDPSSRFGYSQCEMYDINWTEVLTAGQKPNETWNTVPCKYGWEFNKTEIPYPTISSDLEWVCTKASYQATAQAIFFIGSMIGGLLFGWMADRFGRIPAITFSCLVGCVGGTASAFARNMIEFAAARFVMGLAYDACIAIPFLLVLEFIAPQYRTLVANMGGAIFYAFFTSTMPWIALACGHWKTFTLVTSLPFALAIFTKLIVPESPKWLLSQGRVEEAIEKVLLIGRVNKKEMPSKMIEQFKLSQANTNNEVEQGNWLEIFRRPLIRKMFILSCLEFMCCSVVFDGLVRSIDGLDFDFFLSFSLISLTELPSLFLVAFIMDYVGRKWMCIIFNTLNCVFCILIAFSSGMLTVVFAISARFAINMSFSTATQWGPEILPTPVRGSGVAIIHLLGLLAVFCSPYIVYLKEYIYWLPLIVFGAISILAVFIAIALPETAMKDMPQTFKEVENLNKNQKLWTMPYLQSRKAKKKQVGRTNDSFEPEV